MNLKQKLQYAVAGASVAIMSLPAMAEDSALITAAKAEVSGAKEGVSSIGAVVIGVAAAMVVVGLIIKAVRKGG